MISPTAATYAEFLRDLADDVEHGRITKCVTLMAGGSESVEGPPHYGFADTYSILGFIAFHVQWIMSRMLAMQPKPKD